MTPRNNPDADSLPVLVPRSDKRLAPFTTDRVRRLELHVREILRDLAKAKRLDSLASPVSPEPDGFCAVVARAACALCRGHCCRNGDDDAFLDDRTLARVQQFSFWHFGWARGQISKPHSWNNY